MRIKHYIEMVQKEKNIDTLHQSIINYFTNNKITKENIIQLSENLNISIDEINEYLYEVINDFLSAGKFKESNIKIEDIDPIQLRKGIVIEMEHTNNKYIARKIALDHLAENNKYYTLLEKMEKEFNT